MKAFKGFLIWVDVLLSSLSRSRAVVRVDTVEVLVIVLLITEEEAGLPEMTSTEQAPPEVLKE